MTPTTRGATRGWVLDVLLGGIPGAVLGGIVAVNVVIFFSGIDRGYEAGIAEVFRENPDAAPGRQNLSGASPMA